MPVDFLQKKSIEQNVEWVGADKKDCLIIATKCLVNL